MRSQTAGNDVGHEAPPKRKRIKGLGWIALVVAVLAVAMFVGFNAFYAAQAT